MGNSGTEGRGAQLTDLPRPPLSLPLSQTLHPPLDSHSAHPSHNRSDPMLSYPPRLEFAAGQTRRDSASSSSVIAAAQIGAGVASPHIDCLARDDLTEEEQQRRGGKAQGQPQRDEEELVESHSSLHQQHAQAPNPQFASSASSNKRGFHQDDEPRNKRPHTDYSSDDVHNPPHRVNEVLSHHSQPFQAPAFAVPDLTSAWQGGQHSPVAPPAPGQPGFKRHNGAMGGHRGGRGGWAGGYTHAQQQRQQQYGEWPGDSGEDNYALASPGTGKHNHLSLGRRIQLLPVRYGWPKLVIYTILGGVFLFLLLHYVNEAALARQQRMEQAGSGASDHVQVFAADPTADPSLRTMTALPESPAASGEVVYKSVHKSGAIPAVTPAAAPAMEAPVAVSEPAPIAPVIVSAGSPLRASPDEEPAPAHSLKDLPPVTRESLVAELGKAFAEKPAAKPVAAPASTPVPAPAPVAAPTVIQAPAPVEPKKAEKVVLKEDIATPAKKHGKADDVSAAAAKKKDSKQGAASSEKTKLIAPEELAALHAASKAVIASVVPSGPFTPQPVGSDGYLLGPDIEVVIATKSNRHELLAQAAQKWGKHVKNLHVFSNAAAPSLPLVTVLPDRPHKDWKPIDTRYHSWRMAMILQTLKDRQVAAGEDPDKKFYLFIDDVTFPLLDSIRTKLDAYRSTHAGAYPLFAGGPLTALNFYKSYWKEQQSRAYQLFKVSKLQTAPSWLWGCSGRYLDLVGPFLSGAAPDSCPTLFGDDVAVAGLTACAGLTAPLPKDKFLFDFWTLEKRNPSEAGLTGGAGKLEEWRKADAYHGVAAGDMLAQSWKEYTEKAGIKSE